MIKALGVAFAATLTFALPARAENVTSFTLDNGMDVVVIEDHRAPVVVHMVWYRAGSADEPTGHSGVAHFLEHLMFKGTEKFPEGAFSDIVEANGGSENAFTSYDYTAYHQRVASDRLPLLMEMEADRMTGTLLDEEAVRTERDVIIEERNQRTDNNPGALFSEQRNAAMYLNHPYSVPVIGWKHEMEALTLDDALAFYRRHYAPNNAVLVVAGDVYPDAVREQAQATYGKIPPVEGLTARVRPQEPRHLSERRLSMSDPRVAQPYLIRTYLAPERDSGDQEKAAALLYLAELLGGEGATSYLGEKLQFDTQQAIYTSAFYDGTSLDDTQFGLVVVPAPGVSLQDAEDALDAALAGFMEDGIDMDLFESLKFQLRASNIYALDNIAGLARRYGEALTTGLTVQDVQDWPEVLANVTPEDVMQAAAEVLVRRNAVTGWLTGEDTPAEEATQ